MGRRPTCGVMSVGDDRLAEAVARSECAVDVLRALGFATSGGNYRSLRERICRAKIDTSHWVHAPGDRRGRDLESILRTDSGYTNRYRLKIRLLKGGRLENRCAICNGAPVWCGRPLTMVLDHIDGNPRNWREENLRLVCPNCNSQLPTFAGRNRKRGRSRRSRT